MAKQKPKKPKKIESIEEFLARGGSINRVPEKTRDPEPSVIRNAAGGPAIFLTLSEADLLYGDPGKAKKVKKTKPALKIDLEALPPALRAKFIAKIREEADGQGYEKELEEIEDDNSELEEDFDSEEE